MPRVALALVPIVLAIGCGHAGRSGSADEAALAARKDLTRQLMERGDWANAFVHADGLYKQRPQDPEILTLRGIVLRERKLLDDAEVDLRAALTADADRAEAHAALGILLDTTARGVEAEHHHRRAVELDGRNPGYLNNLGFSLLVRGKAKEAIAMLQQSARLDPMNPRLRTNLGFAFAATGDMPRAAREFQIGAPAADAKNNLGFAYEARGDLHNAYDLYVEALKLDPASRRARRNLDHVAAKLGRPLPTELMEPAPSAHVPGETAAREQPTHPAETGHEETP